MAESIEPGFYEGVKALNVRPLCSFSHTSFLPCSISLFIDRKKTQAKMRYQVRMFHGIDVRTLQRREVDGRSL